ncbi:MAG: hypothetical protein IPO66_00425 [Rhodanobacteraceae bacterium]|nr:hypothetical protein [Rhodanobacteraceae bacterium]
MRRAFMPPLAACIWLALPPTGTVADSGQRFAVRGEVHALGLSDDRRFALSAELRQTPNTESADGRYALKAVNVPEAGCDPAAELFANGFEGN